MFKAPPGFHYMPDGTLMKNEDHRDDMMTMDSMSTPTSTTTSTTSTSTGASVGY